MKVSPIVFVFMMIGVIVFAFLVSRKPTVSSPVVLLKDTVRLYAYETSKKGFPNNVLYIDDIDYKDIYVKYYENLLKGENPYLTFPIKGLPKYEPLSVIGYTEDSLLAKFFCILSDKKKSRSVLLEGYVYSVLLHENAPIERGSSK
jgi:hypothetical protein